MSESQTQEFDSDPLPNGPHSSAQSQQSMAPTPFGTVNDTIFKSVVKIFVVRCSPN